jgi:hypothetical protein
MSTTELLAEQREKTPRQEENQQVLLFGEEEARNLREQWRQIQGAFVDEPRSAVKRADELVANTIKRVAETFSEGRGRLESEWSRGDDVSTEDLRVAMQRYRAFFDRMLKV